MAQFSFKGTAFPYNPAKLVFSREWGLPVWNTPSGGVVQQTGKRPLLISGLGQLCGDLAAGYAKLEQLFQQSGSGVLCLPGFSPMRCYFKSLRATAQAGPAVLDYEFSFLEDTDYPILVTADEQDYLLSESGDTLYSIALRQGCTVEELLTLNPQISSPTQLERGTVVWLS